jgi:hypothetical protein
MAYADYIHCEICDTKVFYIGSTYSEQANLYDIKAICKKCGLNFTVQAVSNEIYKRHEEEETNGAN